MFALNKAGKFLVALLHSDEMKGENNRWLLDGDGDAIKWKQRHRPMVVMLLLLPRRGVST